jgi:hypothetical protein
MAEILNIREEKDEEKRLDMMYQMFVSLNEGQRFIPDGKVPIGTIQVFAKNKEMMFPEGFEICNGENKTHDLRGSFTNEIVYIERVK